MPRGPHAERIPVPPVQDQAPWRTDGFSWSANEPGAHVPLSPKTEPPSPHRVSCRNKLPSTTNRASGLICKLLARSYLSGAPGAIRTHDPRLRRPIFRLVPPGTARNHESTNSTVNKGRNGDQGCRLLSSVVPWCILILDPPWIHEFAPCDPRAITPRVACPSVRRRLP